MRRMIARFIAITAAQRLAIIESDIADIDQAIELLQRQRREAERRLAITRIQVKADARRGVSA